MVTDCVDTANHSMEDDEILIILRTYIPKVFDIYHETNVLSLIKMIVNKNRLAKEVKIEYNKHSEIKKALEQCDGLTSAIRSQQERT